MVVYLCGILLLAYWCRSSMERSLHHQVTIIQLLTTIPSCTSTEISCKSGGPERRRQQSAAIFEPSVLPTRMMSWPPPFPFTVPGVLSTKILISSLCFILPQTIEYFTFPRRNFLQYIIHFFTTEKIDPRVLLLSALTNRHA